MNFFGMGPMEITVIMVIALIIFGPGKLPEIGATVGKAVRDFRNATQELTGEFERTMQEVQGAADEVKQSAMEVQDTTRDAVRLDQSRSSATRSAQPLPIAAGYPVEQAVVRTPTKDDPLADLMFGGSDSTADVRPHQPVLASPPSDSPANGFTFPDAADATIVEVNGAIQADHSEPTSEPDDESLSAVSDSQSRTVA